VTHLQRLLDKSSGESVTRINRCSKDERRSFVRFIQLESFIIDGRCLPENERGIYDTRVSPHFESSLRSFQFVLSGLMRAEISTRSIRALKGTPVTYDHDGEYYRKRARDSHNDGVTIPNARECAVYISVVETAG
jgi:hypothetical protein